MRLIISHGLQPRFFTVQNERPKTETEKMLELLNFDALTLSEEVQKTRSGQTSYKNNLTPQERIVIHMCYLLTNRFENEYDLVLKLVQAFISKVGQSLQPKQCSDFLLVVSQLAVPRHAYESWEDCLGTFLSVMGPEKFFTHLPLQLTEHDMNSLTYAQDSRSYLLNIARQKLKRADIVFFVQDFLPLIKRLEQQRQICLRQNRQDYSPIKAKKYETLICQIWELLPIFLR